ncbi:TPA: hypothetical protein ACJG8M_004616 [Salmonella enterica subsp. diarizonae serovar 50:k:z]
MRQRWKPEGARQQSWLDAQHDVAARKGDAQRGEGNDEHKKTRLVRSGFNVLPQTEAGTTKQLTMKYYVMDSVNANGAE